MGTTQIVNSVGSEGYVTVYEPSEELSTILEETLRLNEVDQQRVQIRRKVIGKPVDVWGEFKDDDIVPPSELSECDVLVMDCEGAEQSILEQMSIKPRSIVVETHPPDAPTQATISLLEEQGYHIEMSEPAYEEGRNYIVAANNEKD